MTTTRNGTVTGTASGRAPGIAAVPGERGGQDIYGAYEPILGWPKPLSQLAGHEQWTWGCGQGIFAESPNRVFMLQRGELPDVLRPPMKTMPELGPSIILPTSGVPFRNATTSSPPGSGASGLLAEDGMHWLVGDRLRRLEAGGSTAC